MNTENVKLQTGRSSTKLEKRVLIVEDDLLWREMIRSQLSAGSRLVSFDYTSSAEEAVSFVKERPHYDLIISDYRLSGEATGLDFWKACQDLDRDAKFVLTSGHNRNYFKLSDVSASFITKTELPNELPEVFNQLDSSTAAASKLSTKKSELTSWIRPLVLSCFAVTALTLSQFALDQSHFALQPPKLPEQITVAKPSQSPPKRKIAATSSLKHLRTVGLVTPELEKRVHAVVAQMDVFLKNANKVK